jgi:hypothetical protein
MNLATHVRVLWRFRLVAIGGLLLGIVLAVLAAYQVSFAGGLNFERRGTETWSSESSILVTQSGFPWGRVTLPGAADAQQPGAVPQAVPKKGKDEDALQFADPSRFSNLAMLYSVISYSDQVRRTLPGHPERGQIQAVPLDATGNGNQFLPIIKLTTKAKTAAGARNLNRDALDGLRNLLMAQQRANDIPLKQRVELGVLNAPAKAELVSGRSLTPSILAFLLCCIAAVALAHVLEALRARPAEALAAVRPSGGGEGLLILGGDGRTEVRRANGHAEGVAARHYPSEERIAPPWRERART